MKELVEKAKEHFQYLINEGKIETIEHNFLFDVTELIHKTDEEYCMVAFCPDDILVNWFYKKRDGKSSLLCKSDNDIKEIPDKFQVLVDEVQKELIAFHENHKFLINRLKVNQQ